jgi:hypothetical protein
MEEKLKLPDLPKSDDVFWEGAEIHCGLLMKEDPNEKHYFIRTSGRQAQCRLCDWGFELDPGDYLIDGHLFNKSGKFVI